MKITKVDNTHAGVKTGKVGTRTDTGFIYRHPDHSAGSAIIPTDKLSSYIRGRIDASMSLYNAFRPLDEGFRKRLEAEVGSDKKDLIGMMEETGTALGKYYNRLVTGSFIKIKQNKQKSNKHRKTTSETYGHGTELKDEAFLPCYKAIRSWITKGDDELRRALDRLDEPQLRILINVMSERYLRKALSRRVKVGENQYADFRAVTKELLMIILINDGSQQEKAFDSIDETNVLRYLRAFYKDYKKEDQARSIEKSIRNNNIPVQCRSYNGEMLLMLSNGDFDGLDEKKRSKKAFLFDFMRDYAAIDGATGHEEKLRSIKRLLILFIYGESEYRACETIRFAEIDKHLAGSAGVFCGRAVKILQNDETEAASGQDIDWMSVRSFLHDHFRERYKECITVLSREYKIDDPKKENWTAQMQQDMAWITWFEDCIERILRIQKGRSRIDRYKLENSYLFRKCWSEFMAFICQKYISLGKAVYHFCLPHDYDLTAEVDSDGVSSYKTYDLRTLPDDIKDTGLTGFDYERIKAVETLQRETAAYVASAAGNFIRSVSRQQDESSDILMKNDYFDRMDKDLVRLSYVRVMRYFGGLSSWKGWDPTLENADISDTSETDHQKQLLDQVRDSIYSVRNHAFHYAKGISTEIAPPMAASRYIVMSMVKKEVQGAGRIIVDKYFSNNTWMFYGENDIIQFLNKLYEKEADIPAQVPSFHSIFTKERLFDTFSEWKFSGDSSDEKIWKNTVYFLMKESYYRAFLQDRDISVRLKRSINRLSSNDKKEEQALSNFKRILGTYIDKNSDIGWSVGEFCQYVMGEYNRQNNEIQKVVTGKQSSGASDIRIYQHLPMLLYKSLRTAFKEYITDTKQAPFFGFIGKPSLKAESVAKKDGGKLSSDSYCSSFKTTVFGDLSGSDMMEKDHLLFHWFLAAHFLSPVQLNHFKGTIKGFISFLDNICKRQAIAHGSLKRRDKSSDDLDVRKENLKGLLRVLDLVSLYSGRTSNDYRDYFPATNDKTSEDVYVGFLSGFLEFNDTDGQITYDALKRFCQKDNGQIEPDGQRGKIKLYYDDESPIPNRNLIYADMYGNAGTIAECLSALGPITMIEKNTRDDRAPENKKGNKGKEKEIPLGKVTYAELRKYYSLQKELEPVFERGHWQTKEELKKQRQYICLKNRVELVDIATYTDIMNDLYIRLVAWCNIWERDQMYYRLGYQYVKLFFTGSIAEDDYRRRLDIKNGPRFEDGAILYQIEAVYNYELPVFVRDSDSTVGRRPSGGGGRSQVSSEKLFKIQYCREDQRCAESVFDEGMEFFDNQAHMKIVKQRRNYIDHLNYYSKQREGRNFSMLDLFGFMYNDMFRYNTNLRKSTTYVLENVLTRYRVLPDLTIDLGKVFDSDIIPMNEGGEDLTVDDNELANSRSVAVFRTSRDKKGLQSDVYTFKNHENKNEKHKINSRSRTFLIQLDKLLEYRQSPT